MSVFLAGSCFDVFEPSAASGASDNSTSILINGTQDAYADGYLIDPATGVRTAQTALWVHAVCSNTPSSPYGTGTKWFRLLNEAGVEVVQAVGHSGGFTIKWLNGAVWQTVGSLGVTGMAEGTLDVEINIAVDGRIAWYWNNQIMGQWNGDTSGLSPIARIRMGRVRDFNSSATYNQIIAASFPTLGHVLKRRVATADGAHVAWTGGFGDVDDAALNDTDAISASADGAKESFTGGTLSGVSVGSVVKAVVVAARCRNDGGGIAPQNVKGLLRISATDYESPAMSIGIGYRGSMAIFMQNPATVADWGASNADVLAAEYGLVAST
jgi:hypothetical protein